LDANGTGVVEYLPLAVLDIVENARTGGIIRAHVRLLMETVDHWPPILVWGDDLVVVVVDGAHRVEAARRLRLEAIRAIRFIGSRDDAYLESVRRNVQHGLPLSFPDRMRAAQRVLARDPDWSDRRISSLCGLSAKVVARLRRGQRDHLSAKDGVGDGFERRIGRDGRSRPAQTGEVQERVRRVLEHNPGRSLRALAAMAEASPETVRVLRAKMAEETLPPPLLHRAGGEAVPKRHRSNENLPAAGQQRLARRDGGAVNGRWLSDPALWACGDGGDFVRWFANSDPGDKWDHFVWAVPVGRVYEIVDEARHRAASWTSFASMLESRIRERVVAPQARGNTVAPAT
jgi:hypothetical protein